MIPVSEMKFVLCSYGSFLPTYRGEIINKFSLAHDPCQDIRHQRSQFCCIAQVFLFQNQSFYYTIQIYIPISNKIFNYP